VAGAKELLMTTDYEAVRKLHYEYNVPLRQIALVAGITRQAISEAFKARGWLVQSPHVRAEKVVKARISIIVKLHKEYRLSIRRIAQLLDLHPERLAALLVQEGYDPSQQPAPLSDWRRRIPEHRRRLIRRACRHSSQEEVADMCGIGQSTVSKIYLEDN
jgi:CRP-like cAMP-binding protein